MGKASAVWFTMSVLGVTMAETMKDPKMANFQPRRSNRGVTNPIRASTKMSTGIWKTSPRPRRPAGDAPGLCGTLTCAISSSSSDGPG